MNDRLSCQFYRRSGHIFLGMSFNIASPRGALVWRSTLTKRVPSPSQSSPAVIVGSDAGSRQGFKLCLVDAQWGRNPVENSMNGVAAARTRSAVHGARHCEGNRCKGRTHKVGLRLT